MNIGKNELIDLRNKVSQFKADTGTKDTVVITIITTYGVVENDISDEVEENSCEMNILFIEIDCAKCGTDLPSVYLPSVYKNCNK